MSRITYDTFYCSSEDASLTTLHRSLEHHLSKLHQEKQQEIYLNSQIKYLESKLQKSKETSQVSLKPSELSKSLTKLKTKVENTTCKLNTLHNENEALRKKIDSKRQEGSTYRRIIGQLNQDIDDSSFIATISSQSKLRVKSEEQTNKERIHKLLNKSTTEREQFNGKLMKIATGISKLKRKEADSMKKHSQKVIETINRPLSSFDIFPLLEKLLESRSTKTENMRKKLKKYRKNCQNIRNGLGKILSAFGKTDFIALAQQFIDSENQMKNVQVYLMDLNSEIDSITSSNSLIFEGLKKTTKSKGNEIFASVKKQMILMKNKVDVLNFKSSVINNTLTRVESMIDNILSKYQKIPENKRTFNVIIDQDADFNEKLSNLEHVIHQTLIMKAYMAKQHSSFGTLRSSLIRDTADRESGLKTVRDVIDHLNISDEVDSEVATSFNFVKLSKTHN